MVLFLEENVFPLSEREKNWERIFLRHGGRRERGKERSLIFMLRRRRKGKPKRKRSESSVS